MTNYDLLERLASFFRRYEVEVYLVGGTVRDWLLGRPNQDLDLAVAGDALTLTRALADELNAAYVPLDEKHATARAVLREPIEPIRYIDVAKLRGSTLAADLTDRDFTVNAMAVSLEDAVRRQFDIIDPLGGQVDLRAGQLRATSKSVLRDDPLRLLRAVRLAAELGFTIEAQTQEWITEQAEAICEPAVERVRDELVRLFARPGTAGYLRLMDTLGLLGPLFPELVAGKGVAQPDIHQWDVFEHLLVTVAQLDRLLDVLGLQPFGELAEWSDGQSDLHGLGLASFNVLDVEQASLDWAYEEAENQLAPFAQRLRSHLESQLVGGRPRFVLLKLVALLHDVGKPKTRSTDTRGEIHFYRHEQVGADMMGDILRRLHFGTREVKIGGTITRYHMRPKWLAKADKVAPRAIYRFFRDTGEPGVDVALLSLADTLAMGNEVRHYPAWGAQLDITNRLLGAWFERRDRVVAPPPLVRGGELIGAFDLEPGPIVGELLEAIREAQATNRVSTRDEALAFAHDWLAGKERMERGQGSRGERGQGSRG